MLGSLLKRYGDEATIIAMSDHGFSHYIKHFGTNAWLRDNGYIRPSRCTALCPNQDDSGFGVNWNKTRAYGIGFNDLYLNLEGREENGIVKPEQREALLQELITKLQAVRDVDGGVVIQKVYRGDQVYSGPAMKYAPDLVLGFKRGYKARGKGTQAKISPKVLAKNTDPWTADHCFAAEEVPGVLFSNRPVRAEAPSLIDLAPTILAEFGLNRPDTMEGRNVFAS